MQYTYSPNHVTSYHEPSVCLQKYITTVPEPRDERQHFLNMFVTSVTKSRIINRMLYILTVTENLHIDTRFFALQSAM